MLIFKKNSRQMSFEQKQNVDPRKVKKSHDNQNKGNWSFLRIVENLIKG